MDKDFKTKLGNNLRKIREKNTKLNQHEFYEQHIQPLAAAGLIKLKRTSDNSTTDYMSKLETGRIECPVNLLVMYSQLGNISIDSLLTGEEFTPSEPHAEEKKEHTLRDAINALFLLDDLFKIKIDSISYEPVSCVIPPQKRKDSVLSFSHIYDDKHPFADHLIHSFLFKWEQVKKASSFMGRAPEINVEQLWRENVANKKTNDTVILEDHVPAYFSEAAGLIEYIPLSKHCHKTDSESPFN